jgi:hypothetical protein
MRARRRGLRLVAEAIREVAVLAAVFIPLDAENADRLTSPLFLVSVVMAALLFSIGVWLEVRT